MIDLITNNPLDVIEIVLMLIIGLLIYKYLPSYFTEKGKYLATKEDIGEITRKVQEVEAEFIKMSTEHQVRFSKLHEKRAEIISELYSRLYDFQWAVSAFLRNFHKKNHEGQNANELDNELYNFTDFFNKHRIYFTDDICLKIDELVETLLESYVPLEGRTPDDNNVKRDWDMCAKVIQKKYPAIKESLENDFRKILGVAKE